MRFLISFVVMACCVLLAGCSPRLQQVAVRGVEDAVRTNNGMVAAMTALQERARIHRKTAMMQTAKTLGSYKEGKQELDRIDKQYESVFDAFREAEQTQAALAAALEMAQELVSGGEMPSMTDLFLLAVQVQGAYNSIATKLGEIR